MALEGRSHGCVWGGARMNEGMMKRIVATPSFQKLLLGNSNVDDRRSQI